jgi:hypothetical protein
MNEEATQSTPKTSIFKKIIGFLDRGITGIVIGALVSTLYFWLAIEKPFLCYAINPVRTSIVKSGQFSDMTVMVNGRQITNDLTGVQIAIWNSGKKPIHGSEILKQIVLRSSNHVPIYKATVSRQRDVTRFGLYTSNILSGEVIFDWRILEHDDGALLQLFYEGDPDTDFTLDGALEGQNRPHRSTKASTKNIFLVMGVTVAAMYVLSAIETLWLRRLQAPKKRVLSNLVVTLITLCTMGILVGIVQTIFSSSTHVTPFGF